MLLYAHKITSTISLTCIQRTGAKYTLKQASVKNNGTHMKRLCYALQRVPLFL